MNFKQWLESEDAEEHAKRKLHGAERYANSSRSDHLGRPKGATVGGNPRYRGGSWWTKKGPSRTQDKKFDIEEGLGSIFFKKSLSSAGGPVHLGTGDPKNAATSYKTGKGSARRNHIMNSLERRNRERAKNER